MNKLWVIFGRILFWMCWPLLTVYMRFGVRTRVLIVSDGDILVVKGWLGSGKWLLPGGGLHRGEDPLNGAIREVKEEVNIGLAADALIPLGISTVRQSGLACRYHQFALELDKKPPVSPQKFEILSVAWLPISDLNGQSVGNDIKEAARLWKKGGKAATL